MKLKLSFLFTFFSIYSWSQATTVTFNASGTFTVPVGVTSINVEAWGGGGAGGGVYTVNLVSRAAAGGGGGAYASKNLTVSSGEILNVVVASETTDIFAGDGVAGGNSYIEGYESLILAAGGSGGEGGDLSSNTRGGAGGTVEASAGDIRIAGETGGNEGSTVPLLNSSGAGGAGANSGGAGGASLSGLFNINKVGNPGEAPGGGGGGARNTFAIARLGGIGAAGRIIISYTAPALKAADNNVSVKSVNKILSINSSDTNINQVFVYDISGNLIYKKDGVSDSKLSINNLRSNNQVLVVKVVLDNNKVEIKKVVY